MRMEHNYWWTRAGPWPVRSSHHASVARHAQPFASDDYPILLFRVFTRGQGVISWRSAGFSLRSSEAYSMQRDSFVHFIPTLGDSTAFRKFAGHLLIFKLKTTGNYPPVSAWSMYLVWEVFNGQGFLACRTGKPITTSWQLCSTRTAFWKDAQVDDLSSECFRAVLPPVP